ncbi:hypothetical protein, partial [Micromonospora echinofusca]
MLLTDPALRRIAADTNDVLPDQLWRHDTATLGPIGDLARLLHHTARAFTDTTTALDTTLTRTATIATTAAHQLDARADLHLPGYQQTLTDALTARERHTTLGAMLVATYRAWRNHRPTLGDSGTRHVLLRPGDPSAGVATLRRREPRTWLVVPDTEAATAFAIPYPDRVVGEVTDTGQGWTPTAYIARPDHPTPLGTTYPLPTCDDLAPACRSLLRWWH